MLLNHEVLFLWFKIEDLCHVVQNPYLLGGTRPTQRGERGKGDRQERTGERLLHADSWSGCSHLY